MPTKSSSTSPVTPSLIISFMVALALTLLGIGTLFLQKQLRQTTNTSSEAASAGGIVELKQATTTLDFQSDSTASITINTHSTQISGLQVTFQIKAVQPATGEATFGSTPILHVTNPNLHLAANSQFVPITNAAQTVIGHSYTGLLVPAPGQPFSTTGAEPLFTISFKPGSPVNYTLSFDNNQSVATLYQGTDDVLKITNDLVFTTNTTNCQYTYSNWSACQNGKQIRTYTSQPSNCPAPNATELERNCNPQCAYVYSDWSACTNGWQTRTYSTNPTNCTWYTQESLGELTRACGDQTSTTNFYPYTYEACWYDRSEGNSTYIVWNKQTFPNVTAVDVSTYSDFREFAHKDVTNATSTLGANFLVTDGTNFRTFSDNKNTLYAFYPDTTYYFRLYNGRHSTTIRYYVPKCAGVGGVSYKQCNESCNSNAQCAPNLTCSNGQCRRAGNVDSTSCVLAPDRGLNRSCNEYCADSRECAAGLTCSWNRCRNPKNLDDTSCRTPSKTSYVYYTPTTTTDTTGKGGPTTNEDTEVQCNEVCASNRDCAIGLRCYENRCRLPANLASVICSATELGTEPTPTKAVASISAAPSTTVTTPPATSETDTDTSSPAGWIAKLVAKLPLILGGILLLIAVLIILPILLRRGSEPAKSVSVPPQKPTELHPTPNAPTATTPTSNSNSMMERLKQRGVQPPGI